VPGESASPAGPGGVSHPVPILPTQATTAAHEPMIIFGAYLALASRTRSLGAASDRI
jgi:hypothetical protein